MFIMQVNECVQGIFSLWYSFHLSIYLFTYFGHKACRVLVPQPEMKPGPMKWKHWVLTTVVAQLVKNLPVMQETWVRSLGREDPLEEEMETHCSTLAWEMPWTEELGGLQSIALQRFGHDWTDRQASLIAQLVKNLPVMQETLVRFLGWEDPLEKG